MQRVAIVTGCNQGIGYEIAKGLCERGYAVIMACRDSKSAAEAEDKIKKASKDFQILHCTLDLGDVTSIHKAAEEVKKLSPNGVDVLVNNAGFAFTSDSKTPFSEQAEVSSKINYYGTKAVTENMLPLLKSGGRVINVSSRSGELTSVSDELAKQWRACKTTADIETLLNKFISGVKNKTFTKEGWPESAYGVSKMGVTALTRVCAKQHPGILFYACCPGYCSTRMTTYEGPKSPKAGADTPIWLATEPNIAKELESGSFAADRKKIEW